MTTNPGSRSPGDHDHLRVLVERLVREGRSEREIAARVAEATAGRPDRGRRLAIPRRWPGRR